MHEKNIGHIICSPGTIFGGVIAQDNIEKKKSIFNIFVDNLKEAKFIRNGTEHDGKSRRTFTNETSKSRR